MRGTQTDIGFKLTSCADGKQRLQAFAISLVQYWAKNNIGCS